MKKNHLFTMCFVALMTAVICVVAPFTIPIGPVPISLANFVIFFTIYLLGWKKSTLSVLLYILIGLVGIPVFSGFSGGIGKAFGPTGGYLLGYIPMVIVAGIFIEKKDGNKLFSVMGMILGTILCYGFGTLWLAYQMSLSFIKALMIGVVPFALGDLVKIGVVAFAGPFVGKRIKRFSLDMSRERK